MGPTKFNIMETLGIKIDKKIKGKLSKIAKMQDRSISSVARIAIEKGLLFFERGGPHRKQKNLTGVDPTIKAWTTPRQPNI